MKSMILIAMLVALLFGASVSDLQAGHGGGLSLGQRLALQRQIQRQQAIRRAQLRRLQFQRQQFGHGGLGLGFGYGVQGLDGCDSLGLGFTY